MNRSFCVFVWHLAKGKFDKYRKSITWSFSKRDDRVLPLTRRSADILSASGRSALRFTTEASIRRLFALWVLRRTGCPRSIAGYLDAPAIRQRGFLLSRCQFLAQLTCGVFAELLFDALVFQRQRQLLASFIQALQHVIRFGPARAATGRSLDHLQPSFCLRASGCALLLEPIKPRPIAAQFFNQHGSVGRVQITRTANATLHQ